MDRKDVEEKELQKEFIKMVIDWNPYYTEEIKENLKKRIDMASELADLIRKL